MTRRRLAPVAVALALATALAGCGDGGRSSSTATTTDVPVTAPGPASSATPGPATTLPGVAGPFAEGRTPVPGFGEVEVRVVEGPDGEPVVLCVLLAETDAQRQRGLMEVTDLGGYDGMLFRFEADSDGGFWMKDTVLPLSIAYLDAAGAVVSTADMDPCPAGTARCPSYPAEGPYRMALEVAQGGLDPLGLVAGSPARLAVGGACAPLPPAS